MKIYINRILIIFCIIYSQFAYSQSYEGRACKQISNDRLRSHLANGFIPRLDLSNQKFNNQEYSKPNYQLYYTNDWSTSILESESKKKEPTRDYGPDEPEEVAYVEYVNSTCKYSPFFAMDNNPKTAWSEGVDGDGIGEILLAYVNITKPIKIWAGFGKSNELFLKNNRPKDITVYVFEAEKELGESQGGIYFESLKIRKKFKITLKDLNGYQELPIPKDIKLTGYKKIHSRDNFILTVIAIQIDSVYKGNEFEDTLISEISN